ncbi:MAG TPA: DUF1521 domain-containing protein [Pyrinomonadaceae bacterium]|jgi:hypothetical protein
MSRVPFVANQLNFFNLGFNAFSLRGLNPELLQLLDSVTDAANALGTFTDKFAALVDKMGTTSALCQCAPVPPPTPADSAHPAGSLQVSGDVITTPGGYKIEMLGQYEWKITGPDGANTRIHGDPHVDEGDREGSVDWDFKRNTTFVLGDGTEIHVTTVPGGASGMTVTGQLEIISGNDYVKVSDIDKGKGQIGTVTQDGRQRTNDYSGFDVVVQGREADDWSYKGKEIIGSENGGDSFKTGGDLHPPTTDRAATPFNRDWANSLFERLVSNWVDSWSSPQNTYNPYSDDGGAARWETNGRYDRGKHIRAMRDAFRALADMYDAIARLNSLSEQLNAGRNTSSRSRLYA